jgi:hypothetical protein
MRSRGCYNVTQATSSAAKHLALESAGHRLIKDGAKALLTGGERTILQLVAQGVAVSQEVANAMGSFDHQQFRVTAVMWLVENNHPICKFVSPLFRVMIELANPAAADLLWVSHNSVSAFVMKLFSVLQPCVATVRTLLCSTEPKQPKRCE